MKKILLRIWQLPQLILSWIIMMIGKGEVLCKVSNKDITVIHKKWMSGTMSLGPYIFTSVTIWNIDQPRMMDYRGHEYGHSIQSIYLGPLYLIVIGLPSITHATLYPLYRKKYDYYSFYTEKWANSIRDRKKTTLW